MTTPHYQHGCAAGSQVRGDASSPVAGYPDNRWYVNFNNGNVNIDHRNNRGFLRAVRSVSPAPAGECQGASEDVPLRALYDAWQRARRKKRPSRNQLDFEAQWGDRLLELQEQLRAGRWRPGGTTCFIAARPKAREIHAPDFGDRVVHHWLVPQIEAVYEPGFVHDSYANRRGKGTHAAVRQLQRHVRQVASGQGGGWYLQLDVHNFFNSIHRPTLWRMLKRRLQARGVPLVAQRATHALLASSPTAHVVHKADAAERALVPAHKRLENAPRGCGLPIGNLSSQFFANVYLDALDQFVKHRLRARRYLRYVDDFVLVHHDREQLVRWRDEIEVFLRDELRLQLKPEQRLRPLRDGIDFLGYVVLPTHTRVRRRVVQHLREAAARWERHHVREQSMCGTPADFRAIASTWASYTGHLRHASSRRLQASLLRRFDWMASATRPRRFAVGLEGQRLQLPRVHRGASRMLDGREHSEWPRVT